MIRNVFEYMGPQGSSSRSSSSSEMVSPNSWNVVETLIYKEKYTRIIPSNKKIYLCDWF